MAGIPQEALALLQSQPHTWKQFKQTFGTLPEGFRPPDAPPEALDYLSKNPDSATQFEETFGYSPQTNAGAPGAANLQGGSQVPGEEEVGSDPSLKFSDVGKMLAKGAARTGAGMARIFRGIAEEFIPDPLLMGGFDEAFEAKQDQNAVRYGESEDERNSAAARHAERETKRAWRIEKIAKDAADTWHQEITPEIQDRITKGVLAKVGKDGTETSAGIKDPVWWLGGISEMLPSFMLSGGVAGAAAKTAYAGATAQALAKAGALGASEKVALRYAQREATKAAVRAAVITGAATEAGLSSGDSIIQVEDTINGLDEETMMNYEPYIEMRERGLTHEAARNKVAQDKGLIAGVAVAIATGLSGIPANKLIGKWISHQAIAATRPGAAVKGLVAEGSQEAIQEGSQQLTENWSLNPITGQDVWEGVLEGALTGFVLGGAMGGAAGGIAGTKKDGEQGTPESRKMAVDIKKFQVARENLEAAKNPRNKVKAADVQNLKSEYGAALAQVSQGMLKSGKLNAAEQQKVADSLNEARAMGIEIPEVADGNQQGKLSAADATGVAPGGGTASDGKASVKAGAAGAGDAPVQLTETETARLAQLNKIANGEQIPDAEMQQLVSEKQVRVSKEGRAVLQPAGRRLRQKLAGMETAVAQAEVAAKEVKAKEAKGTPQAQRLARKKLREKTGTPTKKLKVAEVTDKVLANRVAAAVKQDPVVNRVRERDAKLVAEREAATEMEKDALLATAPPIKQPKTAVAQALQDAIRNRNMREIRAQRKPASQVTSEELVEAATLTPRSTPAERKLDIEDGFAMRKPAGKIKFRHYSNLSDDSVTLDPEFKGKGLPGRERARGGPKTVDLYAYDMPDSQVEGDLLSRTEYEVEVESDDLYDIDADPAGLREQLGDKDADGYAFNAGTKAAAYTKAIQDAGYKGYLKTSEPYSGQARLFEQVPAKRRVREAVKQEQEEVALSKPDAKRINPNGSFNGLQLAPITEDMRVQKPDGSVLLPGLYEVRLSDVELRTPIDNATRTPVLAEEIRKSGRITPVLVERDVNGVLHVREGMHRAHALAALGYESIPAKIAETEDTSDSAMRVGRGKGSMSKMELHDAVAQIRDNLGFGMRIVDSATDLPIPPDMMSKHADAEGLFARTPFGGDIYLVRANIRDAEHARVIATHEIVGHYGLRGLLADQYGPVMDKMFAAFEKESRDAAARNGIKLHGPMIGSSSLLSRQRLAAEEVIAYSAEKVLDEDLDAKDSVWHRVMRAIRNLLRRYGIMQQMTAGHVTDLIYSSRDYVRSNAAKRNRAMVEYNSRLGKEMVLGDVVLAEGERLYGMESAVEIPGRGRVEIGPFEPARAAARQYMSDRGIPYMPVSNYAKVNKERAKRIAAAFDQMQHDPANPRVKAAYDAMIKETVAQWHAIAKTGLKVEFITPGMADPYAASPRLSTQDVRDNNHLWVFPTDSGFGTTETAADARVANPLLAPTEVKIDGRTLLANDVFRIVHDYFGHVKEGVGFRADGEENAWRSHAAMYSPLARRAMTSETRGQNSWVNFGPHGEQNRNASGEKTVYADQKIGLLPEEFSRLDEDFELEIAFARPQKNPQLDTPEFKAWFGKSKIRTMSGEPKVLYHGTNRSFSQFDPDRGDNGLIFMTDAPALADQYSGKLDPFGMWTPNVMPLYVKMERPLELKNVRNGRSSKKPMSWDNIPKAALPSDVRNEYESRVSGPATTNNISRIARELGYDGVIFRNTMDGIGDYDADGIGDYDHDRGDDIYVAFESKAIKSAVGNIGAFDPSQADITLRKPTANEEARATVAKIAKHLSEDELAKLNRATAKKVVDLFEQLPDDAEMAAAALAGQAKRGWYRESAKALVNVFGHDSPRFAGLLAAMSPQCSVEMNLRNALNTWKEWTAAGRPTDRDGIFAAMKKAAPVSDRRVDKGQTGAHGVLDAWVNNSVRVLSSAAPESVTLSGPKVSSFAANLRGETDAVTLDTWMANYAKVDQKLFKGSGFNEKTGDPGKGPGYLAYTARVRQAAKRLTKMTGSKWTPAEVQETIWSWTKALYESADAFGSMGTAKELVENKELTDDLINATPDFHTLFQQEEHRAVLEAAGYADQLAGLESSAFGGVEGEAQQAVEPDQRKLISAAKRLDELRAERYQERYGNENQDDFAFSRPAPEFEFPPLGDIEAARVKKARDIQRKIRELFATGQRRKADGQETIAYPHEQRQMEALTNQYMALTGTDLTSFMVRMIQWSMKGADIDVAFMKGVPTGGNADLESFLGKIGAKPVPLKQRFKEFSDGLLDRWTVAMQDHFYGIRRAEDIAGISLGDSGYMSARMSTGAASLMRATLEEGFPEWDSTNQQTRAPQIGGNKGFFDIIKPLGDQVNTWLAWMVANRASRLQTEGRENLFTPAEIAAARALGANNPLFQQVAAEYAQFKSKILDFAEDSGIIDPTTRPLWDNADHVPFYRVMENGAVKAGGAGGGLGFVKNQIKTLKGGERNLGDPLENMVKNWSNLIEASVRAHAARLTVDNLDGTGLVVKIPNSGHIVITPADAASFLANNPKLVSDLQSIGLNPVATDPATLAAIQQMFGKKAPEGDDIVSVWRDGQREHWRVNDDLLFRSLQSINPTVWGGWMNIFRMPKRLLTETITIVPDFGVKNFWRDMWGVFVQGKNDGSMIPMIPVYDSVRGAVKYAMRADSAKDLMAGGASFEGTGYNEQTAAQAARRAGILAGQNVGSKIINTPAKAYLMYRDLMSAAENAHRVAVYDRTLAQGGTRKQALFEAKDLMDFSMRGNSAVARFLVESVPFWGARVAGLTTLGRRIRQNPAGVFLRGMLLATATAALLAFNYDDERYKGLTKDQKNLYWHVFIGDTHYRIPKPFEVGTIFGTIPEAIGDAVLTNAGEPDAMKQSAQLVSHAFTEALDLSPQVGTVWPIFELAMNKNSFTQAPITTMSDEGKLPEDQDSPSVSPTYRLLARSMPDFAPDALRSPKKLQHLGKAYVGTLQDYVLAVTDKLARAQMGETAPPEKDSGEKLFFKSFVDTGPSRNTKYMNEMYNVADQAEEVYRSLNARMAGGESDIARGEQLLTDGEDLLFSRKAFSDASDQVSNIRKAQRAIQLDQAMTPAEKKAQIDELQETANYVAQSVWDYRPGGKLSPSVAAKLMGATQQEQVKTLRDAGLPASADLINSLKQAP